MLNIDTAETEAVRGQAMRLYDEILERTRSVDDRFEDIGQNALLDVVIRFPVPYFHPRGGELGSYDLVCAEFDPFQVIPHEERVCRRLVLLCSALAKSTLVTEPLERSGLAFLALPSIEGQVKTKLYMDRFMAEHGLDREEPGLILVVVGGGLLLNVGAYVAERGQNQLLLYPTTALAMADGSGGKVRINTLAFGHAYKHIYKSFYEPNRIVIDWRFLRSLPLLQRRCGLVEIIKHAVFQSPGLYRYLMENAEIILREDMWLLKAILWAADLKRVCLEIDVEENENGSRRILRGGHGFSDRLEESVHFSIPHGLAVAVGIMMELQEEKAVQKLSEAAAIFDTYGIPTDLDGCRRLLVESQAGG